MFFRKQRVYADAAAATPLSPHARAELERLVPLFGNPGALHSEAVAAKKELERAREIIAASIGAHPDEIVFTGSGTEANNLAIAGTLRPLLREHGELGAVTSPIEHQSVLEPLHALEHDGLYITPAEVDAAGVVTPEALAAAINDETVFVSLQLINSEIGTVQSIRELMKTVRRARTNRGPGGLPIIVHCDASQAPLWIDIAVESLGIDLLTIDGQKVCGPKGVGALYVRRGTPIEPIIVGGGQENGLRGGTANVPLVGSFAAALYDAQHDAANRAQHVRAVRDYLFSLIQQVAPAVVIHGPDLSRRAANNLNISIPGLEGEKAVIAMDAQGVAISTRSACSTDEDTLSHVLVAIGTPAERAAEAIRITLLPSATRADAREIARALAHIARRYGGGIE